MRSDADAHLGVGVHIQAVAAARVAAGALKHGAAGIHGFYPHAAYRLLADIAVIQPAIARKGRPIEAQLAGNAYFPGRRRGNVLNPPRPGCGIAVAGRILGDIGGHFEGDSAKRSAWGQGGGVARR